MQTLFTALHIIRKALAFKNLIFNNNLVIIYRAIKNTMNGFRPYAFVNLVAAIINKVKKPFIVYF